MVFGILIDVPLVVGGFLIMFRFRKRLARAVLRVKLPPLALYLILSVPLIIFEEQIDCMPAWCGMVAIPPTLPFLLIEIMVLGGIVLWRHAKNVLRVTLAYSVFGILWEIFFGGLVGAPPVVIALLAPYVGVGYAFVSMLPLTVLIEGKTAREDGKMSLPAPVSGAAGALPLNSSSLECFRYFHRRGSGPRSFRL
jgi:hypothetical protein